MCLYILGNKPAHSRGQLNCLLKAKSFNIHRMYIFNNYNILILKKIIQVLNILV